MNRILSILSAIGIMLLFFAELYFLDGPDPVQALSVEHLIIGYAFQFLFGATTLIYCGFAAIHAVQRIQSPRDRAAYMLFVVGFNILGSCIYYCSMYQTFRKKGQGGLILDK